MPSPFASAMARADRKIDAKMADAVRFIPMANGDFAEIEDPERPAFEVVALVNFQDPSAADVAKLMARYAYEESEIEVLRSELDGRELRKDDQVQLLDYPDAPRFKISRVYLRDPTRVQITLAILSQV